MSANTFIFPSLNVRQYFIFPSLNVRQYFYLS